ncbi:MAG TPA: di-heme oxidoredictase family protein [Polyangia bacterium]|nr:di-heme oxidoredictase family protein [Polyangia bacterium]
MRALLGRTVFLRARLSSSLASIAALAACAAGCGDSSAPPAAVDPSSSLANLFDVPVSGVSADWRARFNDGDALFTIVLRDADGLGPLYTRQACGDCHNDEDGLRGPGFAQKMSVVEADGLTPSPDQSELPWGPTVHPFVTAGATTPIVPPADPDVRVTNRIGPSVLGRGYLEAVEDSEIQRVAAAEAARTDGIHGIVNSYSYASQPNPDPTFNAHQPGDTVIGRFGLKARIGTLDEFVADALQNDMGITSPLRPTEFANPDGLTDDEKPGIDASADDVNLRADYVRAIAIPWRAAPDPAAQALFDQVLCSACHVPTLHTQPDYPIAALAGVDAPLYTDLLLHDMGDGLSDSLDDGEGVATARTWRTAPLIGLRFSREFLHDGRATTLTDAVLDHDGNGSEAHGSVQMFRALTADQQAALLDFVGSL